MHLTAAVTLKVNITSQNEPFKMVMNLRSPSPIHVYKSVPNQEKFMHLVCNEGSWRNEASNNKVGMVVETSSTQSAPNGPVEVVLNGNVSTSVNNLKLGNNSYLEGDTENVQIQHSKSERMWKWCGRAKMHISKRPEALTFLEPVDWVKLGLPLYPNIIKNLMDLGTIKDKLERAEYFSIFDFDKDVRLVWKNAKKFNKSRSKIYKSAELLRREWTQIFERIRKDPAAAEIWGKKAVAPNQKDLPGVFSFINDSIKKKMGNAEWRAPPKDKSSGSRGQRPKPHHREPSTLSEPPHPRRSDFGEITENQIGACSIRKTVPLSPPNGLSQESIQHTNSRRSTSVPSFSKVLEDKSKLIKVNLKKNICFRWRKGRCRKEKSCPYA